MTVKYEPAIDRGRLVAVVRDAYGLDTVRLEFVPVGYAAVCYVLHEASGGRAFLKLWPDTAAGRAIAARQGGVLALLRALAGRGLFARVPTPVATRAGAWSASLDGTPFAIFTFLAGQAPPPLDAWSPEMHDELAGVIAAIHRATPGLADVLPPREVFAIPFEGDLRRGLALAERVGPGARPGLRALRDRVAPRRAEILGHLARLHRLGAAVRQLAGPLVLCHTDMGGDNLLVDDRGHLWVLDWDDATLAPPEHDLHAALDGDVGRFLAVYEAAGGARPLHLDHFAFSLLRRYLGDMTARLVRVLEEETTAQEDEEELAGMEEWGFARWARLEATLAEIAAALGRRRGG